MPDPSTDVPIQAPLRRSAANPRYFADHAGRAVYLAGSHTWANLQDLGPEGEKPFDYRAWLDMMSGYGHNFMRLWQWMLPSGGPWTADPHVFDPLPYLRTGPGTAADGKPRFNLDAWNETYFNRLRDRVIRAGERGIYVSLMLFDAWCLRYSTEERDGYGVHPFHHDNNVNGIHAGVNRDNRCDFCTLDDPAVVARQKSFVHKVIDTVGDLDNVLYEIVNEMPFDPRGWEWHCAMVEAIRRHEQGRPKQHPVGMTDDGGGYNQALLTGPADWISPGAGREPAWRYDPPVAQGGKVIVTDTDHLWGHGGSYRWVWKSFLRGLNVLFMDPWAPVPGRSVEGYPGQGALNTRDYVDWEPLRAALGETRRISLELDLNRTFPRPDLASTGYCLAEPGVAYVVYTPEDPGARVTLRGPAVYHTTWIRARDGHRVNAGAVSVPKDTEFFVVSPLGHDAVLLLQREGRRVASADLTIPRPVR